MGEQASSCPSALAKVTRARALGDSCQQKREALRWGYWPDMESWWQHLEGYPLLCRGRT